MTEAYKLKFLDFAAMFSMIKRFVLPRLILEQIVQILKKEREIEKYKLS